MPYIFHKQFLSEQCFKLDKDDEKVGYLNINGLKHSLHCEFVNGDRNLLNLQLLCLSDTRLTKRDSDQDLSGILNNWNIVYRSDCTDNKKHMGLLLLSPKNGYHVQPFAESFSNEHINAGNQVKIQILHAKHIDEIITFIYCRITPSLEEVREIRKLTHFSSFILGDLNMNPAIKEQKEKLDILCGTDKIMHLNAVTFKNNNQLDHIMSAPILP